MICEYMSGFLGNGWSLLVSYVCDKTLIDCLVVFSQSTMLFFVVKLFIPLLAFKLLQVLPFSHWDWVTYMCVNELTIIGSDNGLSPGRRQAIIWTNTGILLIGSLGTNFSEILIKIYIFSFKKMHSKMSSGKLVAILSQPQCVNQSLQ